MTEEVQVVQAEPAPEQVVTATPEPEVQAPVVAEEQQQAPKTFSQEELDKAIAKRLDRERRKWEREHAAMQPPQQPVTQPEGEAVDPVALAERIANEREAARQRAELVSAYHEREEEARDKYSDFEQVAYNPMLKITQVMAETIQSSDVGPDVAYFLGTNPKEAERISKLSPFLQAKEIGRIEAKLISEPIQKRTTNAPPPIAPIAGKATSTPMYDTTDPRSLKTMSTSEWIEAERQRQIRKLQANR